MVGTMALPRPQFTKGITIVCQQEASLSCAEGANITMYRYHRPRRWRGGFFFPFPFLIFLFIMNAGHLSVGFFSLVLPIIIILALGSIIGNRVWGSYRQPYQNNQSTYYNQNPNPYTTQYYQPQQPYTPYQQGYQESRQPRETYQESSGRTAQEQYQEYEQPQAQYPEQPPMQ